MFYEEDREMEADENHGPGIDEQISDYEFYGKYACHFGNGSGQLIPDEFIKQPKK